MRPTEIRSTTPINRRRDLLRRPPAPWICGQGYAFPTTPQDHQPQQKRSIHVVPKAANSVCYRHVVRIDEEQIRDHLGKIVRGSVEEALNALLDAEADRLCKAARYERTEARCDTRAGSYERGLHTRAGEVRRKRPIKTVWVVGWQAPRVLAGRCPCGFAAVPAGFRRRSR